MNHVSGDQAFVFLCLKLFSVMYYLLRRVTMTQPGVDSFLSCRPPTDRWCPFWRWTPLMKTNCCCIVPFSRQPIEKRLLCPAGGRQSCWLWGPSLFWRRSVSLQTFNRCDGFLYFQCAFRVPFLSSCSEQSDSRLLVCESSESLEPEIVQWFPKSHATCEELDSGHRRSGEHDYVWHAGTGTCPLHITLTLGWWMNI